MFPSLNQIPNLNRRGPMQTPRFVVQFDYLDLRWLPVSGPGQRTRLSQENAWAQRSSSDQGTTFLDANGLLHTVRYSVQTVLGYVAFISDRALDHIREAHGIPAKLIVWIVNNPNIVVPDYSDRSVHLYYRVVQTTYITVVVQGREGIHFIKTAHPANYLKGLASNQLRASDILYVERGFQWRKKRRLKQET